MTELGQDAKRIDRKARTLALQPDDDVSLRDALDLIAELAVVVALLADRAAYTVRS